MNSRNFSVIVIGAGITGIGAAYYLRANNISYAILEGKDDVGGVWNTHRWHGARCDSDFIKYSFSFKPYLSAQCLQGRQQIQQYLRSVAEEFSILENIRFNTRVTRAVFSTREKRWTVHTSQGSFTAQFLINGNGYFSDQPYVPVFKDADKFKGEIIHTSDLYAARTFSGKNVVVVGSGSTAICCAPELARVSKSLVLLQRSPSYIYEISNRAGPLIVLCQNLYRLGIRFPVKWLRHYLQLRDDLVFVGFRRFPRIARFTESSIVLTSGESIECDTCILATGLNLRFFSFDLYVGEARIAVERINFYKGVMVGGIPNYFHPMGSWHSAWTQRLEPVTQFAIRIIAHMKKHGLGTVSVERREVDAAPGITPNYVMRCVSTLPRLQGTSNLPSIDNIFATRFDPRSFNFS